MLAYVLEQTYILFHTRYGNHFSIIGIVFVPIHTRKIFDTFIVDVNDTGRYNVDRTETNTTRLGLSADQRLCFVLVGRWVVFVVQ